MRESAPGWKISPLGRLVDIAIGGTPSRDIPRYWAIEGTEGFPWVAISDLHERVITNTKEQITPVGVANSNVKPVIPGTVLMSFKLSLGRMAFAGTDLFTNEAIAAFKSRGAIDEQYLYYVLPEAVRSAATDVAIKGATLNKKSLAALQISHPALNAQKAIARVLASIDTAIEKTKALIAKHQQIKVGLMHNLFTRGVLPNGQLRPPRSEAPELYRETALGWIPQEWLVRRLGGLAAIVSGVTLGAKPGPNDVIDAPYLRLANVQDGYLDLSEIKTVRVSRSTLEQLRLLPGDVLMNEGGDFDKLGRGTVWLGEIEDCVHQNHVFRVRTDQSQLLPRYLALYSASSFGKSYFLRSSKQSTNLASINSTQLNAYPIALAPIEEQAGIVERLGATGGRIEGLEREAEKLQKQKLGLMQDLLTGRVPVEVDGQGSATSEQALEQKVLSRLGERAQALEVDIDAI